ncbi:hypothetical protein DLAC_08637 [Tieghemostelium lacteum]|uniref:Transmembrane protein n=1 Tax=Tieghemostelium lacteum TaxID=361077 RepID=A0A151Z7X2_TIELA|nr:hypothetical protein DLAC_08637 [Tieghemostelium lacteum]|eukprot:KYQ90051.1 hypothetical protein DLAC_08637 [Tieghemostelium lacteum]
MSTNSTSHESSNSGSAADLSGGWSGFTTSFFTNLIIGVVILVVFYFLRMVYRTFYCARVIKANGEESIVVTSPLEWIRYTYRFPLESVFESRGIDAYMHLQFLYLCIKFLMIILVFGIGVLLPINYTSYNKDLEVVHNVTLNSLDTVSIASVPEGSPRLWAHTLSIPLFTFLAYYMFANTYKIYLDKRIRWMSKHHSRNYTVLVKEMSTSINTAQEMNDFFQPHFANNAIISCHIVYREESLRQLWNKHRSIQRKLDRAVAECQASKHAPTRAIGWRPGCLGGAVEPTIPYLENKLVKADQTLKTAQREASEKKDFTNRSVKTRFSKITPYNLMKWTNRTSTTGFITFSRMSYASQAVRCVFSKDNGKYQVFSAPETKNIKWKNLTTPRKERLIRRIIVSVIFFLLFCFWTFPVTAISAISNIENLSKVPVLNWMVDIVELNSFLRGLVEGYLPSLALVAFMGLLPLIIRGVITLNKEDTKTIFYHKIFTTYWAFLVVNVFLVVTISGSVLSILFKILEDLTLSQILTLFGSSLPTQSSFFINYILVQSLTSVPLDIVRPIELIVGIIRAARESAPGEKLEAISREDPTKLNCVKYARELLIFVITLSYSTLSPFIIPFGLLYFLIDFFVSKYNHIYSFCPKYQSGGTVWPLVFNRLCVGLAIYQVTALGMFILKAFIPGIVISFPMPFITLFYWWRTIRRYKRVCSVLPLNICPEEEFIGNEFIKTYEDPVLNISKLDISHV